MWNHLYCNSSTSKMKPIVTDFAPNPVLLLVCVLNVLVRAHTTVVDIMNCLSGHLPMSFSCFSSTLSPVFSNHLKVVEPPRFLPERGALLRQLQLLSSLCEGIIVLILLHVTYKTHGSINMEFVVLIINCISMTMA